MGTDAGTTTLCSVAAVLGESGVVCDIPSMLRRGAQPGGQVTRAGRHPGGHVIGRPPSTCTCTWSTVCPPC